MQNNNTEIGFQDLLFCGSGACLIMFIIFSIKLSGATIINSEKYSGRSNGFGQVAAKLESKKFGTDKYVTVVNYYFDSRVNRDMLYNHFDNDGGDYSVEFEYNRYDSYKDSKFILTQFFSESETSFQLREIKDKKGQIIKGINCELVECKIPLVKGRQSVDIVTNEYPNVIIDNIKIDFLSENIQNDIKKPEFSDVKTLVKEVIISVEEFQRLIINKKILNPQLKTNE